MVGRAEAAALPHQPTWHFCTELRCEKMGSSWDRCHHNNLNRYGQQTHKRWKDHSPLLKLTERLGNVPISPLKECSANFSWISLKCFSFLPMSTPHNQILHSRTAVLAQIQGFIQRQPQISYKLINLEYLEYFLPEHHWKKTSGVIS